MIIDHISLGVRDYQQSKAFFTPALAPLGIEVVMEVEGWTGMGRGGKPELWFGVQSEPQRPMHIAFTAQYREQVRAFHQAALAAGGHDNGPPGIREIYHPSYYAAFVLSPEGHNIEAVCHVPEPGAAATQSSAATQGSTGAQGTNSDIYPSLTYENASAAIDWLCRAFGFTRRFAVPGAGGRIEHSELTLGNGVIMIGSPKEQDNRRSPRALNGVAQALSVFVEDPDAHYKVALAAGAKLVRELRTEEYGARGYMVLDPEGHLWYFGNYRPGGFWEASDS